MTRLAPDVSIVVPVYRSAPTLVELHRRVGAVMRELGRSYEWVFVNDASPDESLRVLADLAGASPLKVIDLPTNVGQHSAIMHGLRAAQGRVAVTLDADLQDPPEAIPLLLARLRGDVAAVYAARHGGFESPFRRITSRLFRMVVRLETGIPTEVSVFLAMERRMVDSLLAQGGHRPYLPGLVVGSGLPLAAIPVQRARRPVGRSAYTTWHRLKTALAIVVSQARLRRAR